MASAVAPNPLLAVRARLNESIDLLNQALGMERAPWLGVALAEVGVAEVPGPGDNPRILYYHSFAPGWGDQDDETAWCSSFACFAVESSGHRATRSKRARSWEAWGVPLEAPFLGAVTVFWRKSPGSGAGHVGFYLAETPTTVYVVGGNQGNAVSIREYPKRQLLGYRGL